MSGGKELLVAVAQAVTTGLGASNFDLVLVSLSDFALTEAGKGGLSLHGLFATFTRAAELRAAEADGQLGKALTTALGNRGPPSSGVYWFKSKDEGSINKVVVPKDNNAPYLQRRLETNLSKLQSDLKAVTENPGYAATAKMLFHAKFVDASSAWAEHVAAVVIAAGDSFVCVPKPAKENKPPPPAAKPPAHKKAANGPRVLTFPCTPTTPANQSIQRAGQLVLQNPELAQQQIHLGSYCDRMYRATHNGDSILGVPSSDLTPDSKAGQKQVLTGQLLQTQLHLVQHARQQQTASPPSPVAQPEFTQAEPAEVVAAEGEGVEGGTP